MILTYVMMMILAQCAEDVLTGFGDCERIYIATMYPFDEESKKRVERPERSGAAGAKLLKNFLEM